MSNDQTCTTPHYLENQKSRIDSHESNWHFLPVQEVTDLLQVNTTTGLTSEEAVKRLAEYGSNTLNVKRSWIPLWVRLLWRHTVNVMNFVLLVAAILSIVVKDYVDFGVILFIIVVNIIIGFLQEYKSETTMSKLKKLTAPTCKVLRDGKKQVVPADTIVPGDVIVLKEGDSVPCDVRLFSCTNLECHEALLTGEPIPIAKTPDAILRKVKSRPSFSSARPSLQQLEPTPLQPVDFSKKTIPVGDRVNCAFMSTTVTKGKGSGVAVATGLKTEIGKIAKSLAKTSNESTPLQKKLNWMGITLMIIAVISLGIVLLAVGLHKGKKALFPEALIVGVSVGVAIIPESLVAVMTLVMSIGVRNMIKKNALVRKLAALETLGAITDICSDKTGTLTEGNMVVTRLWLDGSLFKVSTKVKDTTIEGVITGEDEVAITTDNMPANMNLLVTVASMCNTSSISIVTEQEEDAEDKKQKKAKKSSEPTLAIVGDPTEIALNKLSHVANMKRETLEQSGYKLVTEYPFDSTIKRMSIVYDKSDFRYTFSKGAPEGVLGLCNKALRKVNSEFVECDITSELEAQIRIANEDIASTGLRVLCLAYKKQPVATAIDEKPVRETSESDLIFLGLVGIQDPPRVEVPDAIKTCAEAGIVVHMITGDHLVTAKAISEDIGILKSTDNAEELVAKATHFDTLTDEQLKKMKELPLVIARCSPQTKVKMVAALHARKKLVAVTGDGTNDAPAINAADIGIAMGKGGSDVTKDASDIVLSDDNFSTIVEAIREGRRIFANIRKFVVHLLSANICQLFALLIPVCIGYEMALNPTQILWVNMITGTPPAISLGVEKASPKVMKGRRKQNLFNTETFCDLLFYGLYMATIVLMAYFVMTVFWLERSLQAARAVSFTTLTLMLLFHAYNCRHVRKSLFLDGVLTSYLLHASVLLGVALQCAILYIPKVNTVLFDMEGLRGDEWAIVVVGTVAFMVGCEIYKIIKRIFIAIFRLIKRLIAKNRKDEEVELQHIV